MATVCLRNVDIAGVVCAVPSNVRSNTDFQVEFSNDEIESVSRMTGVRSRRIADDNTCASDLCAISAERLMKDLGWEKGSIDALVFVSQTPDYVLPPTACVLQDRLALSQKCLAFDINLGCSGYVYGLWLTSSLVASESVSRALLLVGDTCSKFVSPADRATALLFGDAGSATALAYGPGKSKMVYVLGTDGGGAADLIIPAGGFRKPSSMDTLKRLPRSDGVLRSEEDLYMDGGEIFNFTIRIVPTMIRDVLTTAEEDISSVDFFLFHQANEFIIKHLAKKLKVPPEKVPMSLREFGNTSCASIPLTLVSEVRTRARTESLSVLMAGFGVGYSWGAAVVKLGPLASAQLIEV